MLKPLLKPYLTILFLLILPLMGLCQQQLPVPKWVNDIGGSGDSKATGMITDSQNNIYVSGFFSGTVDFDPSAGVKNLTSVGGDDIYVAKYTPAGALVWAVSMGGDGLDQVNNMTVDKNGNPTIIGQYQSSTLNAGTLSFQNNGAEDIFIIHLDMNGNILWGKSIGAAETDRGEEVATDSQGDVIATAIFQSTITVGNSVFTASGQFNGLIVKYDVSGNLIWDMNLGVSGDTEIFGDGVDANGNIIVSGIYSGNVDFDPLGVHHIVNSPSNQGFVAKYTPAGKLIWVNTVVGNFVNGQAVVGINSNNDIYITGAFSFGLTFGTFTLNASGSQDTFFAKYSSNGTFQFAKDLGSSSGSSFPYQVRSDQANNIYISGYFSGAVDFNPDPNVSNIVSDHGQRDFYVAKYDVNGNYQWAFGGGSPGCDQTLGIELAVDNSNDVVLGGSFCQTVDFDPSTCVTDNVTAQNFISDTYIAKYLQSTTLTGQITNFTVPQQISPAVIGQANHTIAITVSPFTDVKTLVPTITVTNNGVLTPASGVAQDFTSPVIYNVTSGCIATPYTVTITLAIPKTLIVCAGASNTITGDVINPAPTSYAWQVFQNNAWVAAPGVVNAKDYQTSALQNATAANLVYGLRRQVTTAGNVTYDSFYNVTVQPSTPISANIATAPSVISFCTSGNPGIITGSTPAGGTGTYIYQWQSSADNITFTDIAGAVAKDYDPPVVNANIYYRRTVTSGTCVAPVSSNVIKITIFPVVANNVITPPAIVSFCSTGDPSTMTGSTPTGGSGAYTYQWQSSADNVTFNDIPGATSKDLDPAAINATTYYRRMVTSGPCSTPLASNVIVITILPPIANNIITAPAVTSFCSTGDPGIITGTIPSGGFGTYTYQWQRSADNVTFTDIPGATAQNFDPGVISITTYYRRIITSGTCGTPLISNVVTINVTATPSTPVLVNPTATICPGNTATFTVASPQQGITYDWYNSPAKTTHLFTGVTYVTGVLNSPATFYVQASNGSCTSVSLASGQVNVISIPLAPGAVANPVAVCNGAATTLSITNPQAGLTYRWYTSSTGGNSVFTGTDFTTPGITNNTTYYVEAVNAGGCTSASRTAVTITANPIPTVTAQGTSICPGTSAALTATSTDQNATINWYANATGGNVVFTGTTFNTSSLNANTTYYAEVVDNITGCVSAARSPAQVQMIQPLQAPVVTVGETTSSSITFQWTAVNGATGYQFSTDNGQTFTDPGNGSNSLTQTISNLQAEQSVTILVRAIGTAPCAISGSSTAVTGKAASPLGDQIYIANAFTPNGDGKNDIVYVHSENIKSLKFYVYDQWGELLYTSLNQQSGWDGTYKGTKEPVGVYVYYVEAIMNDGKQVNKKGTITLLR